MTAEMRETLFRVALPLVVIAVIVFVARARDISFRDHLGFRFPSWDNALLWLLLFIGLVVVEEVLWKTLGLPQPEPWGSKYPGVVKALRVFAMIVLAPVSEELLFRGMFYYTISKTALTEVGAVVTTSAAFAALHYQSGIRGLLFVLVDGLFFGTVRYSTGSTVLTTVLHILGNSYAAYQRLSGSEAIDGSC
jgi:membrane protease YdiL (CAAX protease family)